MEDLLALLLPAGVALGWWGGKWYYSQKYLARHTQTIRRGYCKGLNYLLSEKPDKAIETFADLLASDIETLETHVALGNLFRRRGEVQKAIEIHEALLARPALTETQRVSAQFELGFDYLRLGLYDRAEMILANLVDYPTHRRPALELLLLIYQDERDWRKALSCVVRLNEIARTPRGESEAQLLCELANEAIVAGQLGMAGDHLAEALLKDPGCVRAVLMKADLLMREDKFGSALELLKTVETHRPAYVPEILRPLIHCHDRLGLPREQLLDYLSRLYGKCRHPQIAIARAGLLREAQGPAAASAFLQGVAKDDPTIHILGALVRQRTDDRVAAEWLSDSRDLVDALDQLIHRQPKYRCGQCGFSGQELHWRCPSCRYWDTTAPIE